jgi:hypothetical protein
MLADNRQALVPMMIAARECVLSLYTWAAKVRQVREVYGWVLGARPEKPEFFFKE